MRTIELRNISKHFGAVRANDHISVTFHGGRIVGVLGENGAGKSTLMKILSGYQPPDSGDIVIDGARAGYHTPEAAIAAGIGMLQQDPLDVGAFTVSENFAYGQRGGMIFSRRKAAQTLETISARFGFDLDPDTPISALSIGQRQQLEIVRLLALGVGTLILDEPTTGISAEQKDLLFDALRELAHRDGMIILLVSHKLEDVIALCDEVVVLRGGKLVGAADMPVTKDELVRLMFGQILAPQARPAVSIGDPVVRFENVSVRGKRVNVENFSLDIRAGEVIGFAGLDGSGQELVIRAAAGLAHTHGGRILVRGADLTHKSHREFLAAGVAFGAAGRLEEGLVAGLTLTEHIALTRDRAALIDWAQARRRTEQQISLYNIKGTPDARVETLSGGNQQRVLLSLLPEQPALLALEQPTRGLDVDSARWVWTQMLARREIGAAILFTSPDLDEIAAYSDRILVFHAGQVYTVPDASQATIDDLGRLIGGDFEGARAEA